jgi:hypothetical protein
MTALVCALLAAPALLAAQAPEHQFGTLREQAELQQQWLKERLEVVLPALMREYDVAMWVIPMREYNEDPLFEALVAPTTFAARRRTVYVFFDRGDAGVERLAFGGSSQGGLYQTPRATEKAPDGRPREFWGADQWTFVADAIRERNPRNIAVDISRDHNFADGLSAGEWEQLQQALGPELAARVTTEDVVWWFRQRFNDLGLGTWFQPSVDIQRAGVSMGDSAAPVIQRGDLLHCDVGLTAYRLNTDTQHMAYVLREGETDAPAGLKRALANGNRLQDIVLAAMRPGLTGNEVLFASLATMREAGIDGTVYTHAIGEHGHGAGPLIGLWDRQDGVPGRGEVKLRPSTWYSIELQATTPVPEWDNQRVQMALEEDAAIPPDGGTRWILRRQETLHLVR